jgi:hypothetical protein
LACDTAGSYPAELREQILKKSAKHADFRVDKDKKRYCSGNYNYFSTLGKTFAAFNNHSQLQRKTFS